MTTEYQPKNIEPLWQKRWESEKSFGAKEEPSKKKYYVLEMFAYPSGKLHMGHVRNYAIGDVIARVKRMQGFNVLHPFGWDAFGLPAEAAALKRGVHPAKWTYDNIAIMSGQLKRLGFSYDWGREVTTCDDDYALQEQKLFLDFYEKGLIYKKESAVNWCENCQTVLANEQVSSGVCWRCDNPVTLKPLSQWFFRITKYAQELLDDHKQLEGGWSEHILTMQKNWIGRSEGVQILFRVDGIDKTIDVFTTRPDTLWGVTFMSIAPEHPLLFELIKGTKEEKSVLKFVEKVRGEDTRRRADPTSEKGGIFTGRYIINPVTNEKVPLYVANFVLMEYGTGVVMAVPAHDQRDFEFAKKYKLPLKTVIASEAKQSQAYEGDGMLVNSDKFSGKNNREAFAEIISFLESKKIGSKKIHYRLKDWGISRQRYWGNPIPMIYCESCGYLPVSKEELPILLPKDVDSSGSGNPLEKHPTFSKTTCHKCGKPARRETDTMDTFVESSWYYLRYTAPKFSDPVDPKAANYWVPVDQYIGGAEHACMHLIYSRFFHKVLRDMGLVKSDEPFLRLLNHGMVLKDGSVMSKSKGNVVDPDEIVEKYGADTLRLFILFAGPPEKEFEWNDAAIEGAHRFLKRVWKLVHSVLRGEARDSRWSLYSAKAGCGNDKSVIASEAQQSQEAKNLQRKIHETIRRVTEDLSEKRYQLNTAIAAMMELMNEFSNFEPKSEEDFAVVKEGVESLLKLLNPFTPHITEELWSNLGNKTMLVATAWPTFDPALATSEVLTIALQVNGKLRGTVEVSTSISDEELEKMALDHPKVKEHIGGRSIKKIVVVRKRLVNIVA